MRLAFPALLLAACGEPAATECTAFDAMTVTDPDDVASQEELEEVLLALDQFAGTTGRAGVCVPEIRLVSTVFDGEAAGLFRRAGEAILVAAGPGVELRTRHELCHALTDLERWHQTRPDLFPADSVDDVDLYPSEEARAHEAFARACDDDPSDLAVSEFGMSCGWPELSVQDAFLLDVIYPGARSWAGTDRTVPVSLQAPVLYSPAGYVSIDAVGGSDREGLVVAVDDVGVPTLRQIDPSTGEEVRSTTLPGDGWRARSIISGDGFTIVADEGDPTTAWRVDESGVVALANFPVGRWDTPSGVVEDGRVWGSTESHSVAATMSIYDVASASASELAWPNGQAIATPWWTSSEGRVYARTQGAEPADELLVLDIASGMWAGFPLSRPYFGSGVAYSDEGWIVTVASPIDTPVLALWSVETEEWAYPADPCGAAAVGREATVLSIGEDAWVWQPGETEGQWALSRLTFDR
jgi:hypothetical protein